MKEGLTDRRGKEPSYFEDKLAEDSMAEGTVKMGLQLEVLGEFIKELGEVLSLHGGLLLEAMA